MRMFSVWTEREKVFIWDRAACKKRKTTCRERAEKDYSDYLFEQGVKIGALSERVWSTFYSSRWKQLLFVRATAFSPPREMWSLLSEEQIQNRKRLWVSCSVTLPYNQEDKTKDHHTRRAECVSTCLDVTVSADKWQFSFSFVSHSYVVDDRTLSVLASDASDVINDHIYTICVRLSFSPCRLQRQTDQTCLDDTCPRLCNTGEKRPEKKSGKIKRSQKIG